MTTTYFVLMYLVEALLTLWVLRWGGAEWMEYRFRAGIFFGYFAIGWSADQIKLYAFLLFVPATLIFLAGLFIPEVRDAVLFY